MTCNEIIKHIEEWAPKEICWLKDNSGLQVGSGSNKINNILLALDASEKVLKEALRKKCNLIITHHPLLFNPLKRIDTTGDRISGIVSQLIKNDIILYSAHTNLDYTRDGVSFSLAKALKLENINFLSTFQAKQYKFTIFIPEPDVEKVADAIFEAGGGVIGEYSKCSFRTKGNGTSEASDKANPAIGKPGKYTVIPEIKLEVIIDSWLLNKVINAVNKTHPYEEPAYDIIPLKNYTTNYGAGAVGTLKTAMGKEEFLKYASKNLNCRSLRHSGEIKKIKKVAVCGGSGSEYLQDAVKAGADAFITADIKYHTFQDAAEKILLIDAGHYETEIFSLDELKKRLEVFVTSQKIKVYKFSGSGNPVSFYNN